MARTRHQTFGQSTFPIVIKFFYRQIRYGRIKWANDIRENPCLLCTAPNLPLDLCIASSLSTHRRVRKSLGPYWGLSSQQVETCRYTSDRGCADILLNKQNNGDSLRRQEDKRRQFSISFWSSLQDLLLYIALYSLWITSTSKTLTHVTTTN